MAKMIKYKFISCEIFGCNESKQIILGKEIISKTEEEYAAACAIAEAEAIPGTIEFSGEFDDIDPTVEERVGNLETDVADTREALEMILAGVTE